MRPRQGEALQCGCFQEIQTNQVFITGDGSSVRKMHAFFIQKSRPLFLRFFLSFVVWPRQGEALQCGCFQEIQINQVFYKP